MVRWRAIGPAAHGESICEVRPLLRTEIISTGARILTKLAINETMRTGHCTQPSQVPFTPSARCPAEPASTAILPRATIQIDLARHLLLINLCLLEAKATFALYAHSATLICSLNRNDPRTLHRSSGLHGPV